VIHLGDYFYEYADNASYSSPVIRDERVLFPAHETVSLDDYRTHHATYRLDPNFRRAHQQHPFITVWDDHESANDAWTGGAENHDPATEGDWEVRKAAAKKAYFEWMPVRGSGDVVSRSLSYGPLMDLIMIDTRLEGRDEQINDVTNPLLYAPDRTLLGQSQKEWLKSELATSPSQRKIIGNQVIFSEFNIGFAAALDPSTTPTALESLFLDIWDGYPAERSELTSFLAAESIGNVVFLTGDFHSSFAFEVADPAFGNPFYDPATGAGAVAVEFATPSISAANFDENLDPGTSALLEAVINQPLPTPFGTFNFNPHMKFVDLDRHGYFVLSVSPAAVQADYYYLADILVPETTESWGAGLVSAAGTNHLVPAAAPAVPKPVQDIPAPDTSDRHGRCHIRH
jgi:alkaline phosphatase D